MAFDSRQPLRACASFALVFARRCSACTREEISLIRLCAHVRRSNVVMSSGFEFGHLYSAPICPEPLLVEAVGGAEASAGGPGKLLCRE